MPYQSNAAYHTIFKCREYRKTFIHPTPGPTPWEVELPRIFMYYLLLFVQRVQGAAQGPHLQSILQCRIYANLNNCGVAGKKIKQSLRL
jgi:hypothetical protein